MATTTARRSKNRKAAKPVSVTTTETVHLHTIAKEKRDELIVSQIFSGNRLGKALAELEAPRNDTRDPRVVSIPAVFDGTRLEEFQAELGLMFQPKHVLEVPEEEEIYKAALHRCGNLLNEWSDNSGHWKTRAEAFELVAKYNAKAKRGRHFDIRWAVCIEIGQPFENELLTCEMTGMVGHMERGTRYPVRIVTPTVDEVKKYCSGRKVMAKPF